MRVSFKTEFFGGINGSLSVKIYKGGAQVGNEILFEESGIRYRELAPGRYLISLGGNASAGGTDFTINKATTPDTPMHFVDVINEFLDLRIPAK